jgi:hypothetical protein
MISLPSHTVLLAVTGFCFSGLIYVNIFFIKKLIEKIDTASSRAARALDNITMISGQLGEIKSEIKELRHVAVEVAVLKATLDLTDTVGEA